MIRTLVPAGEALRRGRRRERIASLVAEEAARFIEEEVDVPAGAVATVTHVEIAPDGSRADIFVSLFPTAHIGIFQERMHRAERAFNVYMREALQMKKPPQMQFRFDDAALKQEHIEKLLEESGI